jgi:hypothetical protein
MVEFVLFNCPFALNEDVADQTAMDPHAHAKYGPSAHTRLQRRSRRAKPWDENAAVSRHYTHLTTDDKRAAIQRLPERDKGPVNDGDG